MACTRALWSGLFFPGLNPVFLTPLVCVFSSSRQEVSWRHAAWCRAAPHYRLRRKHKHTAITL